MSPAVASHAAPQVPPEAASANGTEKQDGSGSSSSEQGQGEDVSGSGDKAITTTVTRISTVTRCPMANEVTCTVGSISTEIITTTYSPGKQTPGPEADPVIQADPEKQAASQFATTEQGEAARHDAKFGFDATGHLAVTMNQVASHSANSNEQYAGGLSDISRQAGGNLADTGNQGAARNANTGGQVSVHQETNVKAIAGTNPSLGQPKGKQNLKVETQPTGTKSDQKSGTQPMGSKSDPKGETQSTGESDHTGGTQGSRTMPSSNSKSFPWWVATIERRGNATFANEDDYRVFRNVKSFGAKGDGVTDDTDAIMAAISNGNRCGPGCRSATVTPALVYFPPGTYLVSRPIGMYYYTQLVGDAIDFPTIKATGKFSGGAVIDANPHFENGTSWYKSIDNFVRQVRNFNIDITEQPITNGTCIHWQVAQATSLENIVCYMSEDPSERNAQRGIFIENGSGGFMANLTFVGGKYGAYLGSQQFTSRNMTFKNCQTAIYMVWNWVWTLHDITIDNCRVGIDMANGGLVPTVGSVVLLDSKFSNTGIGINTTYSPTQSGTQGSLVLENVDMSSNVSTAIQNPLTRKVVLDGNRKIYSWVQGRIYDGAHGREAQGERTLSRPDALTDKAGGKFVTKSKPQYRHLDSSKFVSVKSRGAKGDGKSDDTLAIRRVFDTIGLDQVVYFDHGAYRITDTIKIPKNVKVVGEAWPLIMASGNSSFTNHENPKPVWKIGEKGDIGNVEIQDLMFTTQGPQPGAVLVEFNVEGETKGSAGLFDVHFRVGGAAGTNLQSDRCRKTPEIKPTKPNPDCFGASMLVHVTSEASIYMENTWLWIADHELDIKGEDQINIYNGRGILLESRKGSWLWGTASEHNVLSNYQISNAKDVFMGLIQTETPYFQGNPDAFEPFAYNASLSDPDFASECSGSKHKACARSWGLRLVNSTDVRVYGGGLYSFFDNYDSSCTNTNDCQDNMIDIEGSSAQLFGVSTKASVNMVTLNGSPAALDADNRNTFCAAIAAFESRG